MRARRHGLCVALVSVCAIAGLVGCGHARPPGLAGTPSSSTGPTAPTDPWGRLAALAATGQDARYVATYTYTSAGSPPRRVTVTVAQDGSWRVDVPGGALGGTVDVAIAGTNAGIFQCAMDATPFCAKLAGASGTVPDRVDPRVEHVFVDWLRVLTDRQAAISVSSARAPAGVAGECFSVEPDATALAAPVAAGTYCYAPDGTLTAADLDIGDLRVSAGPAPGPATVTLPGPVAANPPLPIASPSPTPSASASATARARPARSP